MTSKDTTTPVPDDVAEADVLMALDHVRKSINGLESNAENIPLNKDFPDDKTRKKALAKVDVKLEIFDTLEILCEDYLIRAASTPSAQYWRTVELNNKQLASLDAVLEVKP